MYITQQQAEELGYMQLTHWGSRPLNTRYGVIPYRKWLELEYDRITSNPDRSGGIITRGNEYALCVNRVAGGEKFWAEQRKAEMEDDLKNVLQIL